MEKQFNINELLSSNHLTTLFKEGAVIQESANSFILLLGDKKPYLSDLESLSQNQILVYQANYWDYIDKSKDNASKNAQNLHYYEQAFKIDRDHLCLLTDRLITQLGLDGRVNRLRIRQDHFADFQNQFDWSQMQFSSGRLRKTVPFTKFEYDVQNFSFWLALDFALRHQDVGFVYGFWTEHQGYLGKTPELLASFENQTLTTMALAGTWSNQIHYQSLNDVDAKTREEHAIVVQDIKSRLGQAESTETYIYNVKYLNHLRTDIFTKIENEKNFIDLVGRLHPTAALGIYPRDLGAAEEFSNLELQNSREIFGAPVGFLTKNYARIYVGIRMFKWNAINSSVSIMCGCGVTAQSHLESEWAELITKKNAVCKMFNLNEEVGSYT